MSIGQELNGKLQQVNSYINKLSTSFYINDMDTEQLKKNFEDQLLQTDKQIAELQASLEKAREYKLKLQGGLETLLLLNPPEEAEEETAAE